jgi:choline dehydrogenase-like flavoprotein
MKKAVVVGSGAGGATAAKELQGAFEVTVLEAGGEFRPFSLNLNALAKAKGLGLFFDEREIQALFPAFRIRKTGDMVLISGKGLGGTTTMATANALRLDRDLKTLGINLDEEFASLREEIPISADHEKGWRPTTRRLFEICGEMGLSPYPTPKMGSHARCRHCGRCVLGCPYGVKWDSRQFVNTARENGAVIITRCKAERVVFKGGRAAGVEARIGLKRRYFQADLVVLAAGGLGTPVILERSGISCRPSLSVDPVLCVAAEFPSSALDREVSMPFIVEREGYIVSPYFDFLSFFFNKNWAYPAKNILSLMVKLADASAGRVSVDGVQKTLTRQDRDKLEEGVAVCREILGRMGIREDQMFLGTLNAGHPGGTLPLTAAEAASLHSPALPPSLVVADATLFPRSLGGPPILTIMALAKRVSRLCQDHYA